MTVDEIKVGSKVRIKDGSPISQDFRFFDWHNPEIIFEVSRIPDKIDDGKTKGFSVAQTHADVKADGYGMLKAKGDIGEYGNGSITVKPEYLELVGDKT